jgi:hypothetical protein
MVHLGSQEVPYRLLLHDVNAIADSLVAARVRVQRMWRRAIGPDLNHCEYEREDSHSARSRGPVFASRGVDHDFLVTLASEDWLLVRALMAHSERSVRSTRFAEMAAAARERTAQHEGRHQIDRQLQLADEMQKRSFRGPETAVLKYIYYRLKN